MLCVLLYRVLLLTEYKSFKNCPCPEQCRNQGRESRGFSHCQTRRVPWRPRSMKRGVALPRFPFRYSCGQPFSQPERTTWDPRHRLYRLWTENFSLFLVWVVVCVSWVATALHRQTEGSHPGSIAMLPSSRGLVCRRNLILVVSFSADWQRW